MSNVRGMEENKFADLVEIQKKKNGDVEYYI